MLFSGGLQNQDTLKPTNIAHIRQIRVDHAQSRAHDQEQDSRARGRGDCFVVAVATVFCAKTDYSHWNIIGDSLDASLR